MRTVRYNTRLLEGCVCPGGVSAQGGVCPGGVYPGECLPRGVCPGVSAQGGVYPGVSAQGCLPRGCLPDNQGLPDNLPWTQWQTPVKTLPCRNYVADGKKDTTISQSNHN